VKTVVRGLGEARINEDFYNKRKIVEKMKF